MNGGAWNPGAGGGAASGRRRAMPFGGLALRKLHSFRSLSRFEQLWFVPVWLTLGLCRAAILLVPFRRIAPLLGAHLGNCAWVPLLRPVQECRARRIGRVVRLAARYTPWASDCFPQAMAARCLLRAYRVPYALFFGVAPGVDREGLAAHAWIAAGRIPVTGGSGFARFTVVACFAG